MNERRNVTRILGRTIGASGGHARVWSFALATIISLVVGVSAAAAQTLTYVGRVRMPDTNTAFTGGGLAIRTHPSGYRELLSIDVSGNVYGVRLPSAWNDTVATNYVLYGKPEVPSGHRLWNIGFDHTGSLLVFHAPFYPANEQPDISSITRYTITANGLTNKQGPFGLPGVHFHRRQGGSFVLPDDVAARFGGRRTVIGFGGYYNIIAGGSPGTSAHAVDFNTGQSTPFLDFPWQGGGTEGERRRGDYSNQWTTGNPQGSGLYDGFWTTTDTRKGAAWGADGMWVVGQEAIGHVRYGNEAGESGFHADGFRSFVRYYSRTELERVWSGQITAQGTRPAYWRLADIAGVPAVLASTTDPQGRMMVNPEPRVNGVVVEGDLLLIGGLQQWGGVYNDYPAVYAFRITGGTWTPSEICGDGIDNDRDGQVDEGCVTPGPGQVACTVSSWSTYQSTSGWTSCNGGQQTRTMRRTRTVVTAPSNGGTPCPALQETFTETRACGGSTGPKRTEICFNGIDDDRDGLTDEGCGQPVLPGAPRRLLRAVQQSTVTLDWRAPITGGPAVAYIVEAGVSPGTSQIGMMVRNGTSVRIPGVNPGKYYARVRGVNAAGSAGPSSNEVAITVGCASRPRNPRALTATANGSAVTLSWVDDDGCNDTSYRLDVGTHAGATDLISAPMSAEAVSVTAGAGLYYARVSTVSPFGVTAPSNEVAIRVTPTQCQVPNFDLDLEVAQYGRLIGLAWSPSNDDAANASDDASPLSYVLEVGSRSGGSNVLTSAVGRTTGLVVPAPPGDYFVRVRAINACGGGSASNEVLIQVR